MTARAKKRPEAPLLPNKSIVCLRKRVDEFTAAQNDQVTRSQCLALACSMASENDNAEQIIRSAKQCFDWIKDAKVPGKPELRAV